MIAGQVATVECIGESVSAWISPTGDWYYTGECGHNEAARAILTAMGVECGYTANGYTNPVDALEERGWAHVSYGEIIIIRRSLTAGQEGAVQEAVSHIIRSGMRNTYQRSFITNAAYYL